MSQMTATARPLRAPRRGPAIAPLRVIPRRLTHTGNGVFATMCIVLLTGGLIALLLLNTALAQGSLTLGDLKRQSADLGAAAGNLEEQIEAASAGGALARSATRLGMVRANERAYIDLAAGTVTGDAIPATAKQAFPIVTGPRDLSAPVVAAPRIGTAGAGLAAAQAAAAARAAAAAATKKPVAGTVVKPPAGATGTTAKPGTGTAAKPGTGTTVKPGTGTTTGATPRSGTASTGGAGATTLEPRTSTSGTSGTNSKPATR